MPLLEIQGLTDPQARRGFDQLNNYVERLAFQPYRSAGIVGTGGAVLERPLLAALSRDISAWKMPSAGSPVISDSEGLPPLWVTGSVGLRIYYTGSASSTANITFRYDLDPVAVGEIPAQATTADFNTPGSSSAGALVMADVPTLVAVDASSVLVGWKIVRLNADAYGANDVWIVAVRPIFYARRQ